MSQEDSQTSSDPVDTMNLGSLPVLSKSPDVPENDNQNDQEMALILFPYQVEKIRTLIMLLAQYRDLLQRLGGGPEAGPGLIDSFDWRSQLQYGYKQEEKEIEVKVGSVKTS